MKSGIMMLVVAMSLSTAVYADDAADHKLTQDVQEALKGGMMHKEYPMVTAEAKDGKVTLKGTVSTLEEKKDLETRVNDVDGVTGVDNEVEVNPASGDGKTTDSSSSALDVKVRKALKGGMFGKAYDTVTFDIGSGGKVTLKGAVSSTDDKTDVEERIRDVEGVTDVDNQIEVNEEMDD
ncbi:MAG: BON domain-containing protein [Chlamydiales bacterium]|nr:BON domain-containing protein [Chlamydiales bacterium]